MKKSIVNELRFKMFQSGSRLNLFIGINVLVFILVGLIAVLDLITGTSLSPWLTEQLAMHAWIQSLAYKFWTPFTYMFFHRDFFHVLFNMLWLYWMGRIFEEYLNNRQFTFTYLAGGLVGAFFYLLAYNLLPAFTNNVTNSSLLGASAGVNAIVIATATLLPEFTIGLLFFGQVRLKYLALAFIVLDFLSIASSNPGGSIAHLGGAFLGFIFIRQLQKGNDWSNIFQKKSKLKVIKTDKSAVRHSILPDQEVVDRILDKISRSGYESLSKKEKEQLFKASEN